MKRVLVGAVIVFLLIGGAYLRFSTLLVKKDNDKPLAGARVAKPKPVIIWSKWKEVVLTDEWSEYFDTPTRWDRVVPPAGGKVEVLFENGSYYDLKGDQTDSMYRAIDIKGDGKFQLKGTLGAKAEIWIGQLQRIVSKQ